MGTDKFFRAKKPILKQYEVFAWFLMKNSKKTTWFIFQADDIF